MKDFIKKHHRDLLIALAWVLIALAWILALKGMFVMTPIEGGIVFGALLIVISLLIAGYKKKIWDNLPFTSSWIGAISSILFIIILFSGFLEWSSNTFSSEYHQSGWHFTGALILASVIPLSFSDCLYSAFKKITFYQIGNFQY